MRTSFGALLAAAAIVSVAGFAASSITVETKASPGVDFSRYKSYSLADMPEVKNPAVRQRLASALDKQLTAKGLVRKDSGGDLTVAMHPRLSKEYSSRDYDTSWDYGWGTWASVSDLTGDSSGSKRLEAVQIGTVIVDLVDTARPQPLCQAHPVGSALETAVRRRVGAFAEHLLDLPGLQVGMEVGAVGAGHAVPRPGIDEVGVLGEMRTRVDVAVLGGHDVVVAVPRRQQRVDLGHHCLASGDGQ